MSVSPSNRGYFLSSQVGTDKRVKGRWCEAVPRQARIWGVYHSTLGLRITKKKKRAGEGGGRSGSLIAGTYAASCGSVSPLVSLALLDVVDVPGLGFRVQGLGFEL